MRSATLARHLVQEDFESECPRAPHFNGEMFRETEEDVAANNGFTLGFSLPSSALSEGDGVTEQHLVIILNGFDQPSRTLYDSRSMGLHALLADRGIASVVLPLPFHFERWPRGSEHYEEIVKSPLNLVLWSQDRFYLGYQQIISDIRQLERDVRIGASPFYEKHFDSSTRIHLLGYSMGGLGAIAAVVRARLDAVPLYDSCILLASGVALRSMHPHRELDIPLEHWRGFLGYYYGEEFDKLREECGSDAEWECLQSIDTSSQTYHIFQEVLLDLRERENIASVVDNLSKSGILAMTGTKDSVAPAARCRFETIVIPQLGHLLIDNARAWRKRAPEIANKILEFIETGEARPFGS